VCWTRAIRSVFPATIPLPYSAHVSTSRCRKLSASCRLTLCCCITQQIRQSTGFTRSFGHSVGIHERAHVTRHRSSTVLLFCGLGDFYSRDAKLATRQCVALYCFETAAWTELICCVYYKLPSTYHTNFYSPNVVAVVRKRTRKLCYRKDYRAMRVTAQSDNTHVVCC